MNNPELSPFVLDESLNYRTAHDCMGFMRRLAESGDATLYPPELCELYPRSPARCMNVFTDRRAPAVDSGVVRNQVVRLSPTTVFSPSHKKPETTAAAAYHWSVSCITAPRLMPSVTVSPR